MYVCMYVKLHGLWLQMMMQHETNLQEYFLIHYLMHCYNRGWSRVLYSCRLKLPNWIPDFVVTFLLKSAAIEVTASVLAH